MEVKPITLTTRTPAITKVLHLDTTRIDRHPVAEISHSLCQPRLTMSTVPADEMFTGLWQLTAQQAKTPSGELERYILIID